MKEYKIEIIYTEGEGSIQTQLNTGGISPYTLIGIFEHFIGKIKNRLDSPEIDTTNQEN
jgi:hypothetical protein